MTDQRQLPPALAARVRDYFGALLSARDVDGAMHELASDVAYWGDDRPVDVISAARTIVHSRIRVADDLEALVLREDLGLTIDEAAQVMKRGPEEVRRLLHAAAAELGGDLEPSAPVDEPTDPEAIPRAAIPTTEPAPRTPGPGPDGPGPDGSEDGPEDGPEHGRRDDPAPEVVTAAAGDEVRTSDEVAPVSSSPPEEPAVTTDPTAPRDTRRRTIALLAVIGVAVAVLAVVLRPSGEPACPQGADVCVVESAMTAAVDQTGEPAASRDTFTTAEDARIWFRFRRDGELADPQVEVIWYRGDERLYKSAFRLPSGDRANVALAKLFMTDAGDYRVELLSSGQVIAEERFRVVVADTDG